MTTTTKGTNNVSHKISWPMKLAIALFLLPLFLSFLAAAFKLPLPTIPGIDVAGGPPPKYVIFMPYRPEAVRASLVYSITLSFIGFIIMIMIGLRGCGYELQHDVNRLFAGFFAVDQNNQKKDTTPQKPH